jgi:WD40 repeat protein
MIISSDSRTLYTGSDDFTIKEWDLITGTLKYTLYGHQDSV